MKWIKDLWDKITARDKLLHITVCGLVTMIATLLCLCFGIDRYISCMIGWVIGWFVGIVKEMYDESEYGFFDGTDIIADFIGNTIITIYTLTILQLL